jgi:6-phosphogluconolactonase
MALSPVTTLGLGTFGLLAAVAFAGTAVAAGPGTSTVFVGTYTGADSKGIYALDFDPGTGTLSAPRLAAETTSPSFLAIDPTRRFLYAVGEVDSVQGRPGGMVVAFSIDPKTGALRPLNAQTSGGGGPCHLVVDKTGRNVLVANYGGGSTEVVRVGPDGRLGAVSSFVQHRGSSANPGRQQGPHAHSVNLDAANRFAVVADLGLDKMLIYKFDPARGTLTPNDPPAAALAPGAGPRHFAFHPGGRFAYTINELNSTVTAWSYDADRGTLTEIQSISTLPSGFKGENYPAEVQVHPSGKFVYGSNRGHDSIAAYTVDPASGKLTFVGTQGEGVKNPRNFAIDPTGGHVLVGSAGLGTVVVFRVNPETGALEATGRSARVPQAVCLKFWAPTE